jgi:hypothetical protein
MTWQIREYGVKAGEMQQWLDEWRTRIVPLRRKFGFQIVGAWTVDEADTFIWIISYDGPRSWKEADADYYNSAERKALNPDPARHLAHTQGRLMTDVKLP